MLPEYLGQTWVKFGYELLLALYAQMAGFGFAGFLRRFLIVSHPLECVVVPSCCDLAEGASDLALNRVLIKPERKGEILNGWKMSRTSAS